MVQRCSWFLLRVVAVVVVVGGAGGATARCSDGEVVVVVVRRRGWCRPQFGCRVGVVGLVVVFRNSRDQVGQKCAEWTFFCMIKSSLGGFCTKNLFSELWFWSICPFTHGVGPSGVGGYMKERAAVGFTARLQRVRSTQYQFWERCFG